MPPARSSTPAKESTVNATTEELRVAIALNGGVSLAVWMGGCAVELDRARRADEGQEPHRIYDSLCHCLGRRLVFDVLTGTSAGGINGALLGAAIAKRRKLDPAFIRERWIKLGDLSAILHESGFESPTALMDGEKFHTHLLVTFEGLLGTKEVAGYEESAPSPPLRPPVIPFLDVTMTDVLGVERRFKDSWGAELVARDYRPCFRFREEDHYTPRALAAAARTSASFPIAFDPWKVEGAARVLAGLPAKTWGVDGGLLNNAPIREALELIPGQTAGSLVRRYVCYINGDPKPPDETTIGELPSLPDVARDVINLPRTAPLVDHLYAIREAVQRPKRATRVQNELLAMDLDQLTAVAAALFETYRRRRTLESLEELVRDPSEAGTMFDLLDETEGDLPWIPCRLEPREETWEWGLLPAQRILHLVLDILRPAIEKAREKERAALLLRRVQIDQLVMRLASARRAVTEPEAINNPSRFVEETTAELVNKAAAEATARASGAWVAVTTAAELLDAAIDEHRAIFDSLHIPKALFGGPQVEGRKERVEYFLQRALAIEVIRRSLAAETEIDDAQPLNFVQLTPEAPSPIFTAHPLKLPSPASAQAKLAGVGLGHFAGFFRSAWRANDFMWGRLDAATRMVDLLLDTPCADTGTGHDKSSPQQRADARAKELAESLLESVGTELWIVNEVLADREDVDGAEATGLVQQLHNVIAAELLAAEEEEPNPMPVTRALFQRAAQLEVLRDELPELLEQSKGDADLGCAALPLDLGEDTSIRGRVGAIRKLYNEGSSLPEVLSDPGEAVSRLGLRTSSQAAFVGLSALRTAKLPMAKFLGLARPPLLAVAGSVATNILHRLTVVAGFWAASLYLTYRMLEAEDVPLKFEYVWSWATFTALVAALGAAGVALVPGLRAWRKVRPLANWCWAAAILLAAGLLAAILVITRGNLDLERVLFAPSAHPLPRPVLIGVLAALGVVSISRFPLQGPFKLLAGLFSKLRTDPGVWLVPLIAFIVLGVLSAQQLFDDIDKSWWRGLAALTALIGAPAVCSAAVLLPHKQSSRKPKSDQEASPV